MPLGRYIVNKINGEHQADNATIARRRAACARCLHRTSMFPSARVENSNCALCGCYIALKTTDLQEVCPIGKW